jgi:hypothetical protein
MGAGSYGATSTRLPQSVNQTRTDGSENPSRGPVCPRPPDHAGIEVLSIHTNRSRETCRRSRSARWCAAGPGRRGRRALTAVTGSLVTKAGVRLSSLAYGTAYAGTGPGGET